MTRLILRKLGSTVVVMAVVAVIVFMLIHLSPGDPAAVIAGDQATSADIDHIRTSLGLDQPLLVQFGAWIGRLVRGDLGRVVVQPCAGGGAGGQSDRADVVDCAGDDGVLDLDGDSAGCAGGVAGGALGGSGDHGGGDRGVFVPDLPGGIRAGLGVCAEVAAAAGAGVHAAGKRGVGGFPAFDLAVVVFGAGLYGVADAHDPQHHDRRAGRGLYPHRACQGGCGRRRCCCATV